MSKNKMKTIDSFFKKKARLDVDVDGESVENNSGEDEEEEEEEGEEEEGEEEEGEEEEGHEEEQVTVEDVVDEENPTRIQRVNDASGVLIVERDPGLRVKFGSILLIPKNKQEKHM